MTYETCNRYLVHLPNYCEKDLDKNSLIIIVYKC